MLKVSLYKNVKKMRLFIFLLICCVFVLGVSIGYYKYPPFQLIVNAKNYLTSSKNIINLTSSKNIINVDKFMSCNITKTSEVINGSHAFIGHAYGAPSKSHFNSFIANNAYDFITQNKSRLRTITFTGDVFSVPSLDKWKKLSQEINENLRIFVAPGNHDIQRPDSRDIFKLSEFGKQDYPILEYLDATPVILEDSVSSSWEVSNKTLELANNKDSEIVIIARHNVPISNLLQFSNSLAGVSADLEEVELLVKRFNNDVSYYWVIGDGGAFPNLPRLSCFTFLNHTFIINGLGEILGDSVLLFNKGNFYQYAIN